ncbi:MAG: NADH-ubiquinone oxidoreductase-F iron-sulfur binding region domain-containing protein [Myxococcota bacterium]|nr:NADH-ubiquinone oxidoreductase-F iron-sulfur binding region domain-containing protein [Myxococcota bacterium]
MTIDEACDRIENGDFDSSATADATAEEPRWQTDPYATPAHHYGQLRSVLASGDRRKAIEQLDASGLRGMGGAGFPTGRKWALVAEQPDSPRYVICNADESEPGTFKDREILRSLPHLMLEGMVLAGHAIDSAKGWIYIRHEYEPELGCLQRALAAAREAGALGENIFGSGFDFDIEVFVSPGGYVLGEETALLEVLEGRRGEPRNKPPYPGVVGLHGKPTLMNNVESFAHVPRIVETGRLDHKFFSISGDVEEPGVHELPVGATFRELLERAGGIVDGANLLAFLPGGASTGFLSAEHIDVPMTFEALRDAGSALGSGAVLVLREGRDLLEASANLTAFFRNESCGKCVPCRIGCEHAVKAIEDGRPEALAELAPLRDVMVDTSICGLGQAALTPVMSVLDGFPEAERGGSGARAKEEDGGGAS